ncbi:MAG: DUF2804 domain-containing protein [Deltaproteobacteria bacterium]|nr:DUF2804 domain-containing protein [Deltaproteobacteria bacterium]
MITTARVAAALACLGACGDTPSDTRAWVAPGIEITEPTPVLDDAGEVVARGWARGPIMTYEREAVRPDLVDRVREWDFYAVHAPDVAIMITLAEIRFAEVGSFVMASVSVHDLVTGERHAQAILLPDPDPMPGTVLDLAPVAGGAYAVSDGSGTMTYAGSAATRVLELAFGTDARLMGGRLELDAPAGESVALVTPWPQPGHFFYENKLLPMPARGFVTVGQRRWDLPAGASWAAMDWVRAVVPETIEWTWAYGMGEVDGQRVGLNLGSVFGDESAGTPDAVIVDGRLHKLPASTWTTPEDPGAPWLFASDDGRVDLALTPTNAYRETQRLDLGFYVSELDKPYGAWSGRVTLEDGTELVVDGLIGAAERVHTVW